MHANTHHQAGFTLIELFIVLSLFVMTYYFSASFYSSWSVKNRMKRVSEEIQYAVSQARTGALLQRDALILSPLSETHDWSQGMILFEDNNTHQYQSDSTVRQVWHWRTRDIQVEWHGFQSTNYLRFATYIHQSAVNGFFIISSQVVPKKIKLIVNRAGLVSKK